MYKPSDALRVLNIVQGEVGGMKNMRPMIKDCEDLSQCRQSMMAVFWQGIDPTDTINFSEHSKALIRIAQDAKKLEKRVTLKQLVDEFKSRKFAQDWKMLDPAVASMSRRICDSIVINLLLSDVLQPDISYTAFNTICYLTPGPRAQYLKKDRLQIHLPRCLMDASEGPDDTFFEAPKKRKRSPDIITIE
ncbi:unnamed protein product [Peronospora belbahrii]|uniref:Uncharacterized protein n=1 Tax=Peronospora belbahrii TaxID=622444 RepID=A0AAU9L9H6_9STRA|nr:unnamed protein product [Peronospora belbahrii]